MGLSLLAFTGVAAAQEYQDDGYGDGTETYDDSDNNGYYDDNFDGDEGTPNEVAPAPPQQPVTHETFQAALSPYGEWITVGAYGTAWRPHTTVVGADFRPYSTGGHWVRSSYGWTWASDYNWGWAPFHYGRWVSDASYGWVWFPDTRWAPAWVDWRNDSGYVAWAPRAPSGWRTSASWCYVPRHRFRSPRVASYVSWQPRRWSQPVYHAPAYRASGYRAPAYRASGYRAPAYRAPVYQAPAYRTHTRPARWGAGVDVTIGGGGRGNHDNGRHRGAYIGGGGGHGRASTFTLPAASNGSGWRHHRGR